MLCFPNCKINLGLYITGRRNDGYHNLETVFYPLPATATTEGGAASVGLCDILEIVPAAETQLHKSGYTIAGSDADNLVLKAYRLLQAMYPGKVPPLSIYLHKLIPMGAGLGGGSADGAFMLRLMNDLCHLGLNDAALGGLALQLGSDCPFFIYNTPQFATGRGELMNSTPIDLSAYSIQVVCPNVHISTRQAFELITPGPAPYDLRLLHTLPVTHWQNHIFNDFEAPVFRQQPQLAVIRQQLYDQGALYASMSGSGSAIFGIFRKGESAQIKVGVNFEVFCF